MFHPERSNADAATIVNDAGRNLACVDAITPSNAVIDFPRLDVDGERLIKMLEHRFSPRGSVHREWSVATEDPRCEYKVAEPENVIAMQMRQKERIHAVNWKMRRCESPLDTRTGVKKENASTNHHCGCRAHNVGKRSRCAGAQGDDYRRICRG